MKNNKQAVFGVILGQAIGDAMGHPTEFCKTVVAKDLPIMNEFTDDTQMMMCIAEAILTAPPNERGFDQFMQEVSRNFIRWEAGDERWGANDRAPGGTCMSSVYALERAGVEKWKATGAGNNGKGNGSVMRSSVVGAAYWRDPDYAFKIGCLTSVNTHNNLEAILAAGSLSYLVASSIAGNALAYSLGALMEILGEWWHYVPMWNSEVTDQSPEFAISRIAAAYALGKTKLTPGAWRAFNGNDFKGVEALAAALFYNVRHSNYREVVLGLANNTGDSDTTAAIGGALAGARWGYGMIPSDWRQRIERTKYLHDLANRIWVFSDKYKPVTQSTS